MRYVLPFVLLTVFACTKSDNTCVEGQTIQCACAGGTLGFQRCTAAGTYDSCDCAAPDAGPLDAGAPTMSDAGPLDAGAPAMSDAGPLDAGVPTSSDAGLQPDAGIDGGSQDLPGAPQNVMATPQPGGALITWSPPASGSSPLTAYTITPFQQGTPGATVSVGGDTLTVTVSGLKAGEVYNFAVVAWNADGEGPAALSSPVTIPVATPGAPAVTATAQPGGALVTWQPPANDGGGAITSYTVTTLDQGGQPVGAPATVTSTSTTISGLTPGATYNFIVVALNAAGAGAPGTSNTITVPTVPAAPLNVTATAIAGGAQVSWSIPATGGSPITSFTVTSFQGTTAGAPQSVGGSSTTATVTGLLPGTTYTIQVTATNAAGTGAAGVSNEVTTPVVPGAPTNVYATAGASSVSLRWSLPDDGGSPVTSSTLTPLIGGQAGTPQIFTGSATSATIHGLTPGTTYAFIVSVTNAVGTGPASSPSNRVVVTVCDPCMWGTTCDVASAQCVPTPPWGECHGVPYDTALMYDSQNCGSCGNDVDQYVPNGWGLCYDGVPRRLECHEAPLGSSDQNPVTGLLQGWKNACDDCNAYLGGYDVPDNGIDEACTGADATNSASQGLYIDPANGSDTTGTGAPTSPFQSFAGVQKLWQHEAVVPPSHTVLYVAAGALTSTLTLPNNVNWGMGVNSLQIFGSYIASPAGTWTRSPPGSRTTTLKSAGPLLDLRNAAGLSGWSLIVDGLDLQVPTGAVGLEFSGPLQVYLQDVGMASVPGATSCTLIWEDYGYVTTSMSLQGGLSIFNSEFSGTCDPLNGVLGSPSGNVTANFSFKLMLYDVTSSTTGQWMPVEQGNNSIIDSNLTEPLQLKNEPCAGSGGFTSYSSWFLAVSSVGNLVAPSCSPTWTLRRYFGGFQQASVAENVVSAQDSKIQMSGPCYGVLTDFTFSGGTFTPSSACNDTPQFFINGTLVGTPHTYTQVHSIQNSKIVGGPILTGDGSISTNLMLGPVSFYSTAQQPWVIENNLFLGTGSSPVVTMTAPNSLFTNNTVINTDPEASSCTLVSNQAAGTQFYGNVLACEATSGSRTGIVEQNASSEVRGLKDNAFGNLTTLFVHDGATSYNSAATLNQNLSTATVLGGNLSVSTVDALLFNDPANEDFSLKAGSPLIDASFDTSAQMWGSVTSDFLGQTRPCGTNPGWDIGAIAYCQ